MRIQLRNMTMMLLGLLGIFVLGNASASDHRILQRTPRSSKAAPRTLSRKFWGTVTEAASEYRTLINVRGGSMGQDDDDEYDQEEDEYDSEAEVSETDDDEHANLADETSGSQRKLGIDKYDESLIPSPMISLGASLGVMLLAKYVDLFHPTTVRIARISFVAYLIALQSFVLLVRMKAKTDNNRSLLIMSSPFNAVLNSQLGDHSGMMKNLASSLLSSELTVMEYDLKQAKSMQSGLLFNMLFVWFLHFKMNQVQPLLIQTITSVSNLIYSPLFQVYVLGRNLERPFKNPAMRQLEPSSDENEVTNDSVGTQSVESSALQEIVEVDDTDGFSSDCDTNDEDA
ncbi:hypothetical protein MPSEU_000441400 [Mayamaea pseudoterrestris]|nr:hypothetical protein MPSEU_000441400 [Mayamaea pseudoterrestris]